MNGKKLPPDACVPVLTLARVCTYVTLSGMPNRSEKWGPRLYTWLEAYWRANDTNANAWADANPGIQGATLSRWKTGTVPSLPAMRAVADAAGISLVDVLGIAGALRPGEAEHEPPVPVAPSVDVAIAQDPELSPLARKTLRDMLAAIREAEASADPPPRKLARRRRA